MIEKLKGFVTILTLFGIGFSIAVFMFQAIAIVRVFSMIF